MARREGVPESEAGLLIRSAYWFARGRLGEAMATLAMMGVLAGCTVRSLQPLFTEENLTFDPQLVGTWAEEREKETWTLQQSRDKAYELTFHDEGQTSQYDAHLVKLSEFLFLDIYPKGVDEAFSVPAHIFIQVRREGDALQVAALNPDWVKERIAAKKVTIAHVLVPERPFGDSRSSIVLTAPTKELQKLVLKYARNTKAFPPAQLHRRK